MNKDKAVAYTRVSSEKQVDNYSLAFQEKTLRNYADNNNLKLLKVFKEEGRSGTNTLRPAYKEMLDFIDKNDVNVILVHKLDRLHRDETNMFDDLKEFKRRNIKVVAVADGVDTSDDNASLATAILAAIGANFSRNLSKETRKGLTSAAEQCLHTGGKAPYGYKVNPDTRLLEVDETTAPAVRKMFSLYSEGFGTSDIIKWLGDNGYKTANGNSFKPNSLNEIFHNEKYRGCYTWDKAVPKDSDGHRNTHKHKDVYTKIEGGCPAIVTKEVFDKVQQRLAENAEKASHKKPNRYSPLTGLIKCSCGSPMCGGVSYSKGKPYYKYNCNDKCGNKAIRADYLEAFVISIITTCLFSEPNRKPLIEELNKLSNSTKAESDNEYRQLRAKLSGLETAQENILKALESGKAKTSLTNRLDRIEKQKEQLCFKISSLQKDSHTFTDTDLAKLQGRFEAYMIMQNTVNCKYFLRNTIEGIEVDDDKITVSLKGGISVSKQTKLMLKGNDNMLKNKMILRETTAKEIDGILLAIGGTDTQGCLAVKLAVDDKTSWGFGSIVDITVPEEYLYTMAADADKDIIELTGTPVSITASVSGGKLTRINELAVR